MDDQQLRERIDGQVDKFKSTRHFARAVFGSPPLGGGHPLPSGHNLAEPMKKRRQKIAKMGRLVLLIHLIVYFFLEVSLA